MVIIANPAKVRKSSFSSGHNIALFERDAAEVLNCTLYYVDGVELTYSRRS